MGLGLRTRTLVSLSSVKTTVDRGVAVTFDDGPVPGTTDRVLDALEALDVQATFFCVGRNAARHPGLLARMRDGGHAIGSHSLTHAALGTQTPRRLAQDYIDGRSAVEDALGTTVSLFRPPYGQLTTATVRIMRAYDTWTWSVDPGDWAADVRTVDLKAKLDEVRDGDVVLLHDWLEPQAPHSFDRSATLAALEHVVRRVRSSGCSFVTLGR